MTCGLEATNTAGETSIPYAQDVWGVEPEAARSIENSQAASDLTSALQQTAAQEKQTAPRELPCSQAQTALLAQGMQSPHIFVFRLLGGFDRQALQAAVDRMVSEHEALRTHVIQHAGAQPYQHVAAPADAAGLEVSIWQHPGGLYDVDDTEAGSMPGWIEEAVEGLQQLRMPLDMAPLAAINLYEVSMTRPST